MNRRDLIWIFYWGALARDILGDELGFYLLLMLIVLLPVLELLAWHRGHWVRRSEVCE